MRVSKSLIIIQLKVVKSYVYNTSMRFKECSDDKSHSKSGCPCSAQTLKIITTVWERVRGNPKRSTEKIA